jgi:hypothetical protein
MFCGLPRYPVITVPHLIKYSKPVQTGMASNEVEGIFVGNSDSVFYEEINIQLITINGPKLSGSIACQDASHILFKECLEFGKSSNFDGVRYGFKVVLVVTFKLKLAISVHELISLHYFEFKSRVSHQCS